MSEATIVSLDWGALNWTAVVAATVFVLGQTISVVTLLVARVRTRQNLAKGLLAEISAHYQEIVDQDPEKLETTAEELERWSPSLWSAHSDIVYRANISNIGIFPKHIVYDVVKLYHTSSMLDNQIAAVGSRKFSEWDLPLKQSTARSVSRLLVEQRHLAEKTIDALKRYVR